MTKYCSDCKWFKPDWSFYFFLDRKNALLFGRCQYPPCNFPEDMAVTKEMPRRSYIHASNARKYHCGIEEPKYWEPRK